MKPFLARAVAGALALGAAPVFALDAAQVFEKVAPSVWALRALDAQEKPIHYGSAVVIASGKVVTACHVLARAKAIELRRGNQVYEAKLESPDVERDLCVLSVPQLGAPPVRLAAAQAKIGQHIYVVHYPQNLGITLGEGLISGLGSEDPKLPPIQTTAVLPPGSAGGGLFDDQGALVGLTTLVLKPSPAAASLRFALPASWIAEAAARAEAQLAKRGEHSASGGARTAAAAPGLPPFGSTWKYSYRDRRYNGPKTTFTVRLGGANGEEVQETTTVEGGSSTNSTLNAQALRFFARKLRGDTAVTELAPYIQPAQLTQLSNDPQRPQGYPAAGAWTVREPQVENDEVVVEAGSFKAVKLVLSGTVAQYGAGNIAASDLLLPVRFRYTVWYAPQVNRYVQIRHETWNRIDSQLGDEVVELVEYRKP